MFSNVYIPPIGSLSDNERRVQRFAADNVFSKCLESCPDSHHIIAGDFNAHNEVWDSHMADDDIGIDIFDWVLDNSMSVANTGASTRSVLSDKQASWSSPDVTLFSSEIEVSKWAPMRRSAPSDHMPIRFRVTPVAPPTGEARRRTAPRKTKYSFKKADWDKYNEEVKRRMASFHLKEAELEDVHVRYRRLVTCLARAGAVIPRGCRVDPVLWWDEDVDTAMRRREELGAVAHESDADRRLWTEACGEVSKLIKEKRRASWQEFASTLCYSSNPEKTAKFVKGIRREARSSEAIVIKKGGKSLASDEEKAEAFKGVYAKVSNATRASGVARPSKVRGVKRRSVVSRLAKLETRRSKQKVRGYCGLVHTPSVKSSAFSMAELEAGLDALSDNKAPGDDGVHNEMLKHLDMAIKQELLAVINLSWASGVTPRGWLLGTIIPLHKPGKDKAQLESYRPVCLMNVIAKLAERLICARLRYDLEERGVLTGCQSGFRAGRSTSDPLLRLVADVQKGFTEKECTVAALVDLSRAFDKVNHQKLLREFEVLGIDPCFARWYRSFLTDRRYRVRFGSKHSRWCRFGMGVPQGSVSGPLLFIIYMNSLATRLAPLTQSVGLRYHFFADDSTLWSSRRTATDAASVVQRGLHIVSGWSRDYQMPISVGKNEAILFSTSTKKGQAFPTLMLGEDQVHFKAAVRLLGVMLDSRLSFKEHLAKLQKECGRRLQQMRAIAGTDWGSSSMDLRALYVSYVRSVLDYAAAAWSPLMCATRKKNLEVIQNSAARTITGCVKCTDIESLLLEANLLPLEVSHRAQAVIMAEKCKRLPKDDPLRGVASEAVAPPRLIKVGADSWRHAAEVELADLCGTTEKDGDGPRISLDNREQLLCFSAVAPWDTAGLEKVSFFTSLSVGCSKKVSSDEERRLATEATLRDRGPHSYELWTDGSVVDEIGAGAAVLFQGDVMLGAARAPSGFLSTSFRSEQVALDAGLLLLFGRGGVVAELTHGSTLLICTDSQSLVSALSKGPLLQDNWLSSMIWKKLLLLVQERGFQRIDVQFVASHCGVVRNELADRAAAEALSRMRDSQDVALIPLSAVKARVKRHAKEGWLKTLNPMRLRHRLSGGRSTNLACYKDMEREDAITLAQLRSGKSRLIGELLVTLGLRREAVCRWCREVPETVEHVYVQCPSDDLRALREELDISSVNVLYDNPDNALLFCWEAIALL